MELRDYLPMFLAEGREHLQTLNLSLVRVERDPRDASTINDIFRIAHTLKGMSATMGFGRMASLTHEMESVMEGLKGGSDGLSREALDTLFGCLDALSRLLDEIEESGREQSDPGELVGQLQRLLAGGAATPGGDLSARCTPAGPAPDVVAAVEAGGLYVAAVTLVLEEDVDMPGVRGYLAVRRAEEHGELVHCDPDVAVIEAGEIEAPEIRIWLATAAEADAIAADLRAQEGVGRCDVVRQEAPARAPAEQAPDHGGAAAPARAAAAPRPRAQTVRVEAERLDVLMHLMGEMVVQRTRLEAIAARSGDAALQTAVHDLSRVAQSLQQMVMQVRMVPVESVFLRFPRMVRDIAGQLGKQVDLQIRGEDTELDRTVVEALGDPLVHLVRNALDHGLETPEERIAGGKPATGTLEISAEHAGGEVLIRVREDGRGVDPAKVGAVAASRGLIAPEAVASLTTDEAVELLFRPGFSTAAVTTDISGRGVGMDAVRTMVRDLGGDCLITSEVGRGSTASIRLPLSLAILPALLVEVDGAPYALPLDRVEQTIRISDSTLRRVRGEHAIVLRDRILPLHDLGLLLGGRPVDPALAAAVVCRAGGSRVGLLVERLVGQQDLVTRPLPAVTDARRALVSGGAVLGDGEIALIVDLDAMSDRTRLAA